MSTTRRRSGAYSAFEPRGRRGLLGDRPYTPATPFKVHVADGAPVQVPAASQIVDGLRKGGDAEFEFVVRAKARPVLLLSGRSDPRTGDLFALRLHRLEKLSDGERQRVEGQREPSLFPLPPERFPGLAEDSAAMVTAPIRLHESALDTRQSLGPARPQGDASPRRALRLLLAVRPPPALGRSDQGAAAPAKSSLIGDWNRSRQFRELLTRSSRSPAYRGTSPRIDGHMSHRGMVIVTLAQTVPLPPPPDLVVMGARR